MLVTPQRAAKIGKNSTLEEATNETCPHCEAILEVVNNLCRNCGQRVSIPSKRQRVFDNWPAKRLHVRQVITGIQFAAAEAYYRHWFQSGLSKIGAVNMESVGSSREPGSGMPATERQVYHRERYRRGERALGPEFSPYVNAIVLQEQEPEIVGKRITGRRDNRQATAVAIEFLKAGLDRLAQAYGLG